MSAISAADVHKIVLACEAGMGSSALVVSQLKRQLAGLPVTVEHTSVTRIPADADVVITCTASRTALVRGEWVPRGALVTAVGSDAADKQELDPGVLARADLLVVDGDPCTNISLLTAPERHLKLVMNRGRIFKQHVDS